MDAINRQRSLRQFATIAFLIALVGSSSLPTLEAQLYYPGPGEDWERRTPEQAGMNREALAAKVQFAEESFDPNGGFDPSNEPYGDTISDR